MARIGKFFGAMMLVAMLACVLGGCSGSGAKSANADSGVEVDMTETRAQIESVLAEAREASYDNLTFQLETETTATTNQAAAKEGEPTQQTMQTTMKGEYDKGSDPNKLHIGYKAVSNMQLERISYDMYLDNELMIIDQKGELFGQEMNQEMLDNYARSITGVATEEEVKKLLDVAKECTIEKSAEGDTVISITADVDKLASSDLVDTSSLPEGCSVATLVASYTIDSDHHFKTVRLMSSTTGTPTYRVVQTYKYSNYNSTTMAEWPDIEAYMMERSGIMTDGNGRQYIVGDDGAVYYIDSISEDGTVYYSTGGDSGGGYTSAGGEEMVYNLYDLLALMEAEEAAAQGQQSQPAQTPQQNPNQNQNQNQNTAPSTSGSTDNTGGQGRAYITVGDNQYYLDDPNSHIEMRDDGTPMLVTEDGNAYPLDYGDGK